MDVNVSLWECDTGLFDWILQKNSHNCGLTTYKFGNHAFDLKWDTLNMSGELIPQMCPGQDN
jgi:hypothetical protein